VNEKLAAEEVLSAAGVAVSDVSGAVASTVHAACAGVASTFPAGSTASTSNVWLPSARPL
jgi:hypothetical protein